VTGRRSNQLNYVPARGVTDGNFRITYDPAGPAWFPLLPEPSESQASDQQPAARPSDSCAGPIAARTTAARKNNHIGFFFLRLSP